MGEKRKQGRSRSTRRGDRSRSRKRDRGSRGKRGRNRGEGETPPIWFGAIFIITGGFIATLGAGWIPVDPSSVHAPGWVIVLAGLVFALGGVMCYTQNLGEDTNNALVLVLMIAFASVFSWVAFGPGEREFSGGGSAGGIGVTGRVGEGAGRIAFGFGSVLMWAIVLAIATRLLRRLRAAG